MIAELRSLVAAHSSERHHKAAIGELFCSDFQRPCAQMLRPTMDNLPPAGRFFRVGPLPFRINATRCQKHKPIMTCAAINCWKRWNGAFGVFVNPRITNAQSCARFGREFPGSRSSHRVGGVEYSAFEDVGAAAGTAYDHRDFHTFRNGLCYQISFELAEWNTRNSDIGCTIPSLGDPEELKIVDRCWVQSRLKGRQTGSANQRCAHDPEGS